MIPEQRLWYAVITQAAIDATAVPHKLPTFKKWAVGRERRNQKKGLPPESKAGFRAAFSARMERYRDTIVQFESARDDARRWLLGKVDGLEDVCVAAGCDPEDIKRQARVLAANGWKIPMAVKKAITLAA